MHYDIIGDIHGQADKLEELLLTLGYTENQGYYSHQDKTRTAIFLGDLIDRGSQNRRVVEIVRAMVERGKAMAVMGNHEYNAICFHTQTSEGKYLRPHTEDKHKQHHDFLKEYPLGNQETHETIAWFKTLPLYLEYEHFRIVHACWDSQTIASMRPFLHGDNSLNMNYLTESATKPDKRNGFHLFDGIECLLKGKEIPLPGGASFADKDGNRRSNIRIRWWYDPTSTKLNYQDLAIGYTDELQHIPTQEVPDLQNIPFYDVADKPVFFGHYWLTGRPSLQQKNVCCLDYSAGKKEKLVAYHFDPDHRNGELHPDDFYEVTW